MQSQADGKVVVIWSVLSQTSRLKSGGRCFPLLMPGLLIFGDPGN